MPISMLYAIIWCRIMGREVAGEPDHYGSWEFTLLPILSARQVTDPFYCHSSVTSKIDSKWCISDG